MSRTNNSKIFKDSKGTRYYESSFFPELQPDITDIYVITTAGDRFDLLSYKYYGDAQYWWVIAHANGIFNGSVAIPTGLQIRIPSDYQKYVAAVNNMDVL